MDLAGVLAPVPTPFDEQGRVDAGRLRNAFARWVDTPLAGFVVLGSTGEAPLVDDDESDVVIAAAREVVPRGRLLVAGTGRESTRAAARASRRAAELGADAVLVRTPSFFKPQMTAEAFVRHYSAVADASPVPVLLYNFTAVTGVNLPPAAAARLAEHGNIAGMKESGGDVVKIAELVRSTPSRFRVLAGSASAFYASLCVGASGGVLALACVLPDACCTLYELVREGRHDEARTLQHELLGIARLLGSTYGVPGIKAALRLIGMDAGVPRLPLAPLGDDDVGVLREALAKVRQARDGLPLARAAARAEPAAGTLRPLG